MLQASRFRVKSCESLRYHPRVLYHIEGDMNVCRCILALLKERFLSAHTHFLRVLLLDQYAGKGDAILKIFDYSRAKVNGC